MAAVFEQKHDFRDLVYKVRVEVIAEIVDSRTGDIVASGNEDQIKELYRELKKRN